MNLTLNIKPPKMSQPLKNLIDSPKPTLAMHNAPLESVEDAWLFWAMSQTGTVLHVSKDPKKFQFKVQDWLAKFPMIHTNNGIEIGELTLVFSTKITECDHLIIADAHHLWTDDIRMQVAYSVSGKVRYYGLKINEYADAKIEGRVSFEDDILAEIITEAQASRIKEIVPPALFKSLYLFEEGVTVELPADFALPLSVGDLA